MKTPVCPCDCHGAGTFGTCSIAGGCGSLPEGCPIVNARERRCARGRYCALVTPERNEKHEPTGVLLAAPIERERGLCKACTSRVERAVAELPEDALILTMMLGDTHGVSEVYVSTSLELSAPLSLALQALRDEIDTELQYWAEPVAEQLGIDWDTYWINRGPVIPRIIRGADLLHGAMSTLLALPEQDHPTWRDGEKVLDPVLGCRETITRDGIEGALALLDLHRRAYSVTGRKKLVIHVDAPCPICSRRAMVREDGGDHAECENCGKTIPEELYDWLVAEMVREQERTALAAVG